MPQQCPCWNTNPLAQTVYPLQGGKVHPSIENPKKNFPKKFLSASTTARKIRWIHWWNPFLNPLTVKGDICNFVVNISELALCLCDRCVWSFQYIATQHLQVGAFIGDVILGRYFALGNTCPVHLFLVSYIFTLKPNMKWIGWPLAEIWPFEISQDSGRLPSWIWSKQK